MDLQHKICLEYIKALKKEAGENAKTNNAAKFAPRE